MPQSASKNNLLAGAFVLVSLVLGVIVVVVLADVGERLQASTSYVVRLSLADGASGLDAGSAVTLGGQKVGRVTGIEFAESDGRLAGIDVAIRVRSTLALYADTRVELVIPLLAGTSTLNIPDLGNRPGAGAARLEPGGRIAARIAPPSFLTQAGYGEEEASRLKSILQNVEETTAIARQVGGDFQTDYAGVRDRVTGLVDRASGVTEDVASITSDVRTRWPQWAGRAESILSQMDDGIAPLVDEGRAGIAEARGVAERFGGVIDENRDDIRDSVANAKSFTERLDGDVQERFMTALDGAISTLDGASATADEMRSVLVESRPELLRTLANMRLASDQLKLTTIEVRQAPWRLLYQPGRKEFENELLFDTVRTYSTAVSDLRLAAETLRTVSEDPTATSGTTGPTVPDLVARLNEAFLRYESAEQSFLDQWIGSEHDE